jgi:hypothetical protein
LVHWFPRAGGENAAPGHGLVFRLQLAEADLDLLVDFTIDDDFPGVGVFRLLGYLPVVANIEFLDRRGVVVEQAFRSLGDERSIAQHNEPFVLAGKLQMLRRLRRRRRRRGGRGRRASRSGLRVGAGNPADVYGRRQGAANDGSHRGQACTAQKSAPVGIQAVAARRIPPGLSRHDSLSLVARCLLLARLPLPETRLT